MKFFSRKEQCKIDVFIIYIYMYVLPSNYALHVGFLSVHVTTLRRWHIRHDLPLRFWFSQFVLPTVDSFLFFPPLPLILYSPRLSPFVNCFRLTDWWMNRSIDLMHMYKICVYIFIGAAASSSSFLPPIFLFSFARNYIFCFWFRLQTSMQPPLEREEKSNKTADRSGFT